MESSLVARLVIVLATTICVSLACVTDSNNNATSVDDGPLSTIDFAYHETLDNKYELSWNFNSTHIVFKTYVKTNGYIGLGISENGRMYPSDLVVGWVKDGQSYFYDRHARSYAPRLDDHQDWTLLSASEEGRYTTLVMVRALDTGDDQDMPITTGLNHVIYSYRGRDPASPEQIYHHGTNRRGSKSITLLVGV